MLALAAPAAPDCPGDSDKPMVLRCDEAGDRAATVAAARAELRRVDATPDEREFAVSLGQAALQELYAADNNPEHLCELEELFAEYMATRGADAAAAGHREQAAAARRKDHPKSCAPARPRRRAGRRRRRRARRARRRRRPARRTTRGAACSSASRCAAPQGARHDDRRCCVAGGGGGFRRRCGGPRRAAR
ncbi:hypothetical protein [Nannocystis pusilla]|uniref:hypothetical protein n=1 Tax=Nannocystis pusilla TaxID=889268 RepID=UPI003B7AEE97